MTSSQEPERDDRDVATVIRMGGPSVQIHPARMERVKAAARDALRREVRRRSLRRRYVWAAASLAAASVVVALALRIVPIGSGGPGSIVEAVMSVALVEGQVWVGPEGGAVPLVAFETLPSGSILTTGEDGRLAIRLDSGHSVRLDHATRIRMGDERTLTVDRGGVYIDSGGHDPGKAALFVETALGSVEEIGTQFEVRVLEGGLRVRLREGAVVVRHDGSARELPQGTELIVSENGNERLREMPRYGHEWDWIAEIAPRMRLEGRTAQEFLDWVARELGLDLVYEDEAVARSAGEIVLRGDVRGLSFDEALDAVLPICRMSYRITDGTMTVSAF